MGVLIFQAPAESTKHELPGGTQVSLRLGRTASDFLTLPGNEFSTPLPPLEINSITDFSGVYCPERTDVLTDL